MNISKNASNLNVRLVSINQMQSASDAELTIYCVCEIINAIYVTKIIILNSLENILPLTASVLFALRCIFFVLFILVP